MQTNNRYYVVADNHLLCASDGTLLVLNEQEFSNLRIDIVLNRLIAVCSDEQFWVAVTHHHDITGFQWLNLRSHLGHINEDQFQLAGRALQISRWHFDHQYCGRCGQPTVAHAKDMAKTCVSCALDLYPRLSPCIITLVTRGDYCLLARHARSSTEKFSCLAGFIEAGESPEQTVAREVFEEVGITVNNMRYIASQPWPFPGQLMLGYFTDYVLGDIVVDQHEILEANWYRYDELPKVPPLATLSGRLIDNFVQQRKLFHSSLV